MTEVETQANAHFGMKDLMQKFGYLDYGNACYCPFHADKQGGKRSAKVYDDTNTLWCFSEQRLYAPYDLLKFEGYSDIEIKEMLPEEVEERDRSKNITIDQASLQDLRKQWSRGKAEFDEFLYDLASILLSE